MPKLIKSNPYRIFFIIFFFLSGYIISSQLNWMTFGLSFLLSSENWRYICVILYACVCLCVCICFALFVTKPRTLRCVCECICYCGLLPVSFVYSPHPYEWMHMWRSSSTWLHVLLCTQYCHLVLSAAFILHLYCFFFSVLW